MIKKEYLPWKITVRYFETENILLDSAVEGEFSPGKSYDDGDWIGFD